MVRKTKKSKRSKKCSKTRHATVKRSKTRRYRSSVTDEIEEMKSALRSGIQVGKQLGKGGLLTAYEAGDRWVIKLLTRRDVVQQKEFRELEQVIKKAVDHGIVIPTVMINAVEHMQLRVPILKDTIQQQILNNIFKFPKYETMLSNLNAKMQDAQLQYNDPKLANFGERSDQLVIVDFLDSFTEQYSPIRSFESIVQPYIEYYKTHGTL